MRAAKNCGSGGGVVRNEFGMREVSVSAARYFFSSGLPLSFNGAKLPSSQQRTNPSVTDFNSSQRARMVFDSGFVISLSVAAVAMTASKSANSWTIWLVAGMRWIGCGQVALGFLM